VKGLRVLVISHMYPHSMCPIAGIFIHNQLRHLVKVGCLVKVVCPVPYAPKILWWSRKWKSYGLIPQSVTMAGIPVYYPRYLRLPGRRFHGFSCYTLYHGINKLVGSIITEFRPHILYAYTATPDGYSGLMLKDKYNIPFVCSFRGSDINVYPNYDRLTFYLTRKVISGADQITTVSNTLKVVAETMEKPKKEIQVVYNGCDLEIFAYNEEGRLQIRKQLGISLKEKVVIFVGHLLEDKGIFELMSAFIKLSVKYSDLHLILVGDGPEYDTLNEMIYSNHLNKNVHLVKSKPYVEIPKWLSAADIFVLPTYSEGLPNVVPEAMACGLPVVATRVGGIPEAVVDGRTGILIDAKNIGQLQQAMKKMITDKEFRLAAGQNGLAYVRKMFDAEQNAEKLAKVLWSLVA
jgi:teichuronic acid biosynthesis glycosyltransferase TuaC